MYVANPIYDVVFKYLLDDEKVARIMLSALLGKEVLELQFRANEVRPRPRKEDRLPVGPEILVLRLDFTATVRLEDGSRKLVLIEIQKAHNAADVMRFRRYLGSQCAAGENVYLDQDGASQALPIVTIYFLGEGLECIDAPVVRINRHYIDAATGERVAIPDPFVEALTHDCIVVQINRLKNRRRTDLEQLLAVFDQGQTARSDPHILDILEENFPERYREVLRRLLRANAEQGIRDGMDVEDDTLATLQDNARKEDALRKVVEDQARTIDEKDKVLKERDKALQEQDKALKEQGKALAEQALLIAELKRHLER